MFIGGKLVKKKTKTKQKQKQSKQTKSKAKDGGFDGRAV